MSINQPPSYQSHQLHQSNQSNQSYQPHHISDTPYPVINWLHQHRRATVHPVIACVLTSIWSIIGGFAYLLVYLLPFPDSDIGQGWLFYSGAVMQFMAQLLLLWGWWRGWLWLRTRKQPSLLANDSNIAHSHNSLNPLNSTKLPNYLAQPRINFLQRIGLSPLKPMTTKYRRKPYGRLPKFLLGAVLGFVSLSMPLGILLVIYGNEAVSLTSNLPALTGSWWGLLAFTLVMFIFQGGVEEVISRGFLLPEIASRWGVTAGVIGNALLFVLFHLANPDLNWIPLVNIFLAGVMFSLLYLRFNSLWVSIGFHGLWNWTQASLYGFAVSGIAVPVSVLNATVNPDMPMWLTGGKFGLEGSALSMLVLVALIGWLLWSIHSVQTMLPKNKMPE
ncbi:CPBP family intramembrane glutamic endopeptidase [Psychrobacter sp. I-STPA6b]|uniref:CPBP family intramembrane glutamic endopeptidase n=1 Tax=Psychrobacter sp. I-STPA6b TaxID=2585718 RepID=UPI001D0CA3A9|nr:CPBP family intramembrane glutamic endopeptidase [Psychrobacter sp. I-STPA6b]